MPIDITLTQLALVSGPLFYFSLRKDPLPSRATFLLPTRPPRIVQGSRGSLPVPFGNPDWHLTYTAKADGNLRTALLLGEAGR